MIQPKNAAKPSISLAYQEGSEVSVEVVALDDVLGEEEAGFLLLVPSVVQGVGFEELEFLLKLPQIDVPSSKNAVVGSSLFAAQGEEGLEGP